MPPFRAKNRQALQQQITGGKLKWPKFLSPAALSLLKGLLTRDPEKRLGSGPDGSAAIRAHPFFKVGRGHGPLLGGPPRLAPRCRTRGSWPHPLLPPPPPSDPRFAPADSPPLRRRRRRRQAINWQALEERRVPSSFKPAVSHSLSVENFDKMWTEQRPEDSPCGTPTNPGFATAFEGFTYVSPSFMAASMAALAAARGGDGAA
jgi:hypothetical protein